MFNISHKRLGPDGIVVDQEEGHRCQSEGGVDVGCYRPKSEQAQHVSTNQEHNQGAYVRSEADVGFAHGLAHQIVNRFNDQFTSCLGAFWNFLHVSSCVIREENHECADDPSKDHRLCDKNVAYADYFSCT